MADQQQQQQAQQDGPEAEYMKKLYGFKGLPLPNGDYSGYKKEIERRLGKMYSFAGTRCEFFERQLVECGTSVGKNALEKICADEYDDFLECISMNKTLKRYQRLQEERQKRGLSFSAPPPVDTLKQYIFKVPWFQK